MGLSDDEKATILNLISILETRTQGGRSKRYICTMFMDLPDRDEFSDYYKFIVKPRSVNMVKEKVNKTPTGDSPEGYNSALEVYDDLSLVFWNAMWYNEEGSQIATDAYRLKYLLDTKWVAEQSLPQPRSVSPPRDAPQKLHAPSPPKKSLPQERPRTPQVTLATSDAPAPIPIPVPPPTQQPASELMDVDVTGMDDDQEEAVPSGERDPDSESIVKQLEKGLPKWQGFGELGWWDCQEMERLDAVVHAIKSHKDVIGNRIAVALESVPEDLAVPNTSTTAPISLKLIESKTRQKEYENSQEFDLDFAHLFDKARKSHDHQSDAYGSVLLLQRLYNALTSPCSPPPPGPPYSSTTNFAFLPAGPGSVKPVHGPETASSWPLAAGVTSHRMNSKDRHYLDEIWVKGWNLKMGDWVHLSNSDDVQHPIVAQVFKLWVGAGTGSPGDITKKGQFGISVAWYFRPEQTFHPPTRTFWENEVFKTSHFAEHPIEDVIEKIAVQFTARHVRGRPRPPWWWVGMKLYVCDSRYHDRDRSFVRIKNWNSCIPEELRKNPDWMPIYPFERMVFPLRYHSPFLAGVKGSGGLIDSLPALSTAGEQDEPGSGRSKRLKRSTTDLGGPVKGAYAAPQVPIQQQQIWQQAQAQGQMPAQFTVPLPSSSTATTTPRRVGRQPASADIGVGGISGGERSIVGSLGAWSNAKMDIIRVGSELAHHFDRHPQTNEILWFPAPPMNQSQPSSRGKRVAYSMDYLHWVAKTEERERQKRQREDEERESVPLTVTEALRGLASQPE